MNPGKPISYYERALAIDEKILGREHPDVAFEFNNLGMANRALGEFQNAMFYFEQALVILKNVYGKQHRQ